MTKEESQAEVGKRVSYSDPVYGKIHDYLVEEAYLLDDNKHVEWVEHCLADDVAYVSHSRKTLKRAYGSGIKYGGGEFNDDKESLRGRARRNIETASAYDRDPEPRICRLVANIIVHETGASNEYAVRSRLVLYRNRFDDPTYDILTASRSDIVRFTDDGPKLVRREVLPDLALLGANYANVFL